jgi:TetR/AcrR family transcriptional regulator, tetracycline repressor protein
MVGTTKTKKGTVADAGSATASGPGARSNEELTRESVIEVALTMADSDGLDAVGIRRLAQHFGVTPMALYWHVKNKEELLDAMGDQVCAGLVLPDADGLPWDEHYHRLLLALLTILRRHPGAASLVGRRLLANSAGRDLTERALSLLRTAGLSTQQSANIARSSLQTMMMLVSAEPGVERGVPRNEWEQLSAHKAAALASLPTDRYPTLVECASAMVNCDDTTAYYSDGVDLFMAGVRAQVPVG